MSMSDETHCNMMWSRAVVAAVFLVVAGSVGGCYIENYHAYQAVNAGTHEVKFVDIPGNPVVWRAEKKEAKQLEERE